MVYLLFIVVIILLFYAILNIGTSFFYFTKYLSLYAFLPFIFILLMGTIEFISNSSPPFFLYFFIIFFPFWIALNYDEAMLPEVDERLLHLISIIYVYNLFVYVSGFTLQILLLISAFPIYLIFAFNLIHHYHSDLMKSLLYIFFLSMLVIIEILNLRYSYIELNSGNVKGWQVLLTLFFLTGTYFYVVVFGVHLFFVTVKEPESPYLRDRKTQLNLFISKTRDEQSSWQLTLFISLFSLIFLSINYFYRLIDHDIIIEVSMLYIFVIHMKRYKILKLMKKHILKF